MNERIEELAKMAGFDIYHWNEHELEKFAELIVRECANSLRTEMYRLDAIPGREVGAQTLDTAQLLIKKHFGVEP
jgi:hypothetical protein